MDAAVSTCYLLPVLTQFPSRRTRRLQYLPSRACYLFLLPLPVCRWVAPVTDTLAACCPVPLTVMMTLQLQPLCPGVYRRTGNHRCANPAAAALDERLSLRTAGEPRALVMAH